MIFGCFKFPIPSTFPASDSPPEAETPILVYGAGSTSAQLIIQLLRTSGYKRILATASPQHHEFVRKLGASEVFDYKSPTLAADILKAAGGPLKYVADPIANQPSFTAIKDVVGPGSKLAVLLPYKNGDSIMTSDGSDLQLSIPDLQKKELPGVDIIEVATAYASANVGVRFSISSQ